MSNKTRQLALIGAWTGTGFGLFMLIVPLMSYQFNSETLVAPFLLLFMALGGYMTLFGLIGLAGVSRLKTHPRLGASILIFSAVGGALPLFTTIIWAVPGIIELVAAIRVFREISKSKRFYFHQSQVRYR